MEFSIQTDVLDLYNLLFGEDTKRFNVVEYEGGLPDAFEFSLCTILYTSDAIVSVERGMPYQLRYQIGYRGRSDSCMEIIKEVRRRLQSHKYIDPLIEKDKIPNVCETLFKLNQRQTDRRYTKVEKKKSHSYTCTLFHENGSRERLDFDPGGNFSTHITNKHPKQKEKILDKIRQLIGCDHDIKRELKWNHFTNKHRNTPVKELYLMPFMASVCGLCGHKFDANLLLEGRENAIQMHIETAHSTYSVSSNPTPSESGPPSLFEQWLDAPSENKRMDLISDNTKKHLLERFLFVRVANDP